MRHGAGDVVPATRVRACACVCACVRSRACLLCVGDREGEGLTGRVQSGGLLKIPSIKCVHWPLPLAHNFPV
jgi:hypothetical protein